MYRWIIYYIEGYEYMVDHYQQYKFYSKSLETDLYIDTYIR